MLKHTVCEGRHHKTKQRKLKKLKISERQKNMKKHTIGQNGPSKHTVWATWNEGRLYQMGVIKTNKKN